MGHTSSYNPNIQELDIRNSFITELPKELLTQRHTHLRTIVATSNQLSDIPRLHYVLPSLAVLILSHNHFKTIPTNLSELESLKQLVCHFIFLFLFIKYHLTFLSFFFRI